ncbi:hypothetical protein BJ684DRAFT_19950 [Piptocephalis cylindrospora]|uniref:Uncharacterized protein n=1 Tax=Piptocephalis cylindrospora TaxID=1907219 RepID=A0A4P9Y4I0_9FUNG|nr:hypothetical protein BJ684DRAFT_19950 [Piptocephalis cylindrospora]|eukprot:RKP13572.1 hypothetical protein BJ684DRAFT_19950 [Piptocephalis cylindrospora]
MHHHFLAFLVLLLHQVSHGLVQAGPSLMDHSGRASLAHVQHWINTNVPDARQRRTANTHHISNSPLSSPSSSQSSMKSYFSKSSHQSSAATDASDNHDENALDNVLDRALAFEEIPFRPLDILIEDRAVEAFTQATSKLSNRRRDLKAHKKSSLSREDVSLYDAWRAKAKGIWPSLSSLASHMGSELPMLIRDINFDEPFIINRDHHHPRHFMAVAGLCFSLENQQVGQFLANVLAGGPRSMMTTSDILHIMHKKKLSTSAHTALRTLWILHLFNVFQSILETRDCLHAAAHREHNGCSLSVNHASVQTVQEEMESELATGGNHPLRQSRVTLIHSMTILSDSLRCNNDPQMVSLSLSKQLFTFLPILQRRLVQDLRAYRQELYDFAHGVERVAIEKGGLMIQRLHD